MSPSTATPTRLEFEAPLRTVDEALLLHLPADVSAQLPSRGQVAVQAVHQAAGVLDRLFRRGLVGHEWHVADKMSSAESPADSSEAFTDEVPRGCVRQMVHVAVSRHTFDVDDVQFLEETLESQLLRCEHRPDILPRQDLRISYEKWPGK